MYTSQEIRNKFLEFFREKKHRIIPSASLIPENDPTVLFTTAGMHPLVPFLLGEKHPAGKRLANVQICVRTGDIDEVGDTTHHTFFEMLGNWSLGDYFKEEAIKFSFEFLTSKKWLNIDKEKLAISVFAGDNDAPKDEEAKKIWMDLGISEKRIRELPKEDNWWGPAGETGPCGPDTEMFYWTGKDPTPVEFNPKDKYWVEIWNDVFMQYFKNKEGKYEPLSQKNVDTGMGLERVLPAINGLDDDYKTDVFWPIIEKIEELSGLKYGERSDEEYIKNGKQCWVDVRKQIRIIADHIKAATMILGDNKGIVPSNIGQGYVLRRLIRRAVRHAKLLGINGFFSEKIADVVIDIYKDVYPEVKQNGIFIKANLLEEEKKFRKTLDQGEVMFNKMSAANNLTGHDAFLLYTTYGFPFELTLELAKEKGIDISKEEFDNEMEKHAELSKTASAGMFKGGLADASEETKRLHTAAHLMLESLRRVLGPQVQQKGSNITSERLRFDFSYPVKMTEEQITRVEDMVNEQIKKRFTVRVKEMPLEEAKKIGAIGVFESKYGEKVKVYFIGEGDDNFSKEICGGPHVQNTCELSRFKIIKEESSSAGVRRIKAMLK